MLATSSFVRRMTAGRSFSALRTATFAALLLSLSLFANSAFAQVDVTATAGTPAASYTTVKGAFDAINLGTHQGAIVVAISGDTTEGTTPATLNSTGAGAASYTSLVLRPTADGVSISGNPAQGFGVIQLNGADNVTLDGDNPNSAGINRNLVVVNTSTATTTFGSAIRIATSATAPYNSNDNITIKNMIANGNVTGGNLSTITTTASSSNSSFGIVAGPNGGATITALSSVTASVASGVTANGLLIDNNAVNRCGRAISFLGNAATASTGVTISNNAIGNQSAVSPAIPPYTTPATTVYSKGIVVSGTASATIGGNTLNNIISYVASTISSIELTSAITNSTITGNTITNVANNGASNAKAILVSSTTGSYLIARNLITNVQALGGASGTAGIDISASSAGGTIELNRIQTVYNRNTSTFGAWGLSLGAGTGIVVRNNFVSDVNMNMSGGAAFSTSFGVLGIRVIGGTGHKIYHNSVNLFGSLLGTPSTTLLTTAFTIGATGQTGMDVRNNIFSNTMTGGTTNVAHVSVFLPSGGTSAMNLTINNNDYVQGTTVGQSGIAHVGTPYTATPAGAPGYAGLYTATDFNPADIAATANLRTYTNTLSAASTNDNASKTVDPLFVSSTDLHIAIASPVVNQGVDVGVAKDIDGQFRVPPPDIGADEPSGITPPANDIAATVIVTPANGSSFGIGATTTPQASFQNVGTATQTNVMVQLTITGPGGYTYGNSQIIPNINPDQVVTVTFTAAPAFTTAGSYTTTASVQTPDATPANDSISGTFQVLAPLAGAYNVPGDYPSLTNAGGVFAALNAAGASANVTINIAADLTGESGANALNELVGGFSVKIKPTGAARTITGTAANLSLIKLNGADNVTVDGSLAGGTDRSLTLTYGNTGGTVVWIASASSTNGAIGNTIKNCVISGNTGTPVISGVLAGSGAALGSPADSPNSNNTIQNNQIFRVQNAAFLSGEATGLDQNWAVTGNSFGSNIAADKLSFRGMLIANAQNFAISSNSIRGVLSGATSSSTMTGIQLANTINTGLISGNQISDIKQINTAGWGSNGIFLGAASLTSSVTVANNFISDVTSFGFAGVGAADNGYGIVVGSGGGYNVYYNSVSLGTNQTAAGSITAGINVLSGIAASAVDLRNNIVANTQMVGTRYAVYVASTAGAGVFTNINYNDYFAQNVGFLTSPRVTLADWQAATTQDANSVAVDPLFVSQTDLHLQSSPVLSPVESAGTPIAGITTDIDGETRPAATPDIGADELTSNLTITPTTVAFGSQPVASTSSEMTVVLANTGALSLNVTTLDAPSAPFVRTVSGTCASTTPITIAGGSSCTLTYTFAPTMATAANQVLTVTSNGPGSGTITLTGTGVQGNLTISTSTVAFGNQLVGSTSSTMTVTLANTGNASLDVTGLTAAAAPFTRTGTGTCGPVTITIAAGGSCTLIYTFSPTAAVTSNQSLTVTANSPGSGTIALSGTGVQGNLTITPTSVPFGNQTANTTSAAMTVTLANTGNASLIVTGLTTATTPFARTGTGTCGALPITIAASASCNLMYTFTPTATGAANQTLTVTANAPGSGTIALSGTGTAVGAVCLTGMPIEVSASAGLAGPTGYGNLTAGFASINAGTHQGNIAVAVCGDTSESASAVLNASGVGASVYSTVLVNPANGAPRTISGNIAGPLVDLNGADNVTIDGLNTGGNALTIANTNTGALTTTSTIRFFGGATNNMVTNASLQGSATMSLATNGGVVFFSTGDNDNNTVSNNNIGPAGSNLPTKLVYGNGSTSTPNDNISISNNNLFDFFNAATSVSGIYVNSGNNAWTISNNRIYQTAARTFTTAGLRYAGITLSTTTAPYGAFTVTNNRIGFGAADGSGTTTISGLTNQIRGLDIISVDTTVPTSLQGNVISGIDQTSTATGSGSTAPFVGIMVGTTRGLVNAGDVSGNTIGSLDGASTIVLNLNGASGGSSLGMYQFHSTPSSVNMSNNKLGAITIQGTGTTAGFTGVYSNSAAAVTSTLSNNTVGGPTTAGAITSLHTGLAAGMFGVRVGGSNAVVTGNTVQNMVGNSSNAGFISASGIFVTNTSTNPSTIRGNTVQSVTNNSGAVSTSIYAIYTSLGVAANVVERNLVHSLLNPSTDPAAQIAGIVGTGTATTTTKFANNMVRIGLDASGAPITTGQTMYGMFEIAGTNNVYHNSIYVGGTGVAASTAATYAFVSNVTTNSRNYVDNIFWNARSNAVAGGGFHIAALYSGNGVNPAGLNADYNDLYATGTDGFVGAYGGTAYPTLAGFQAATGQDANSFSDNPQFIAPNGSAVAGDLHISPTIATPIEGTGLAIASVTDDFDGQVRAGQTPVDVGADAGNFVPQVGNLTITPTALLFGQVGVGMTSAEMTVTLANNGTGSLQVTALTPATSPFARTATGTCSATLPITIAAGGSCTLTYTFMPTSNGPFNQTLTVTANAPGSGTIMLSGTGIQGNLSITPNNVAFGNQTVGTTSAAMPVTFTNIGNAPVTVTTLTAPTSPFGTAPLAALEVPTGFVNCGSAPFTLAAGASCSIGYTFSPTATGPFTQMLTATSSGLGGGTITLSGTGVQGALTISPTTVDFGDQSVGTTSGASTVTLSNTGNATLNVTTLTPATSPFARLGGTCGGTPIAITAGGSCTLTYTFSPTAAGPAMQTLTVTSDAPGSGTITLMGNGVQGTLVVSPTTVDFGSPDVFTTTAFMSVTLSNTGAGSLQINSLTLAAAPFQRTTDGTCGNSLPITIPAGGSCTLTYKFAPTTAGVQSQNFTVSNNGTGGSGMFTLTGNGISDRIFRDGFDGPLPPEAEL